ncbi:MAG TPA: hypothetical protein VN782_11265 [Usitatibacter sp.]|nr:hypothetical protein [Usitatibacter sp.]
MSPEIARIQVWQCVGCGRIDLPRPCVGICRDEKKAYVTAEDHDAVVAQLQAETEKLRRLVREIAGVTPRAGEFERGYRALQERARRLLEEIAAA